LFHILLESDVRGKEKRPTGLSFYFVIPMHTWRESAEAILAILHGKVEPYRVVE